MLCLVQVYLEHDMITRPVNKFPINGKEDLYEYDVIQRFKNELEAKAYVRAHPEVILLL